MSWGCAYWVNCDEPDGCDAVFEMQGVRLRELEAAARSAGWAVGRRAFCPDHRRQEKIDQVTAGMEAKA